MNAGNACAIVFQRAISTRDGKARSRNWSSAPASPAFGNADQGRGGVVPVAPDDRIQHLDKPGGLHPDFQLRILLRERCNRGQRPYRIGSNALVRVLHGVLEVIHHERLGRSVPNDVGGDGALLRVARAAQRLMEAVVILIDQRHELLLVGPGCGVGRECVATGEIFARLPGTGGLGERSKEGTVVPGDLRRECYVALRRQVEIEMRCPALFDAYVDNSLLSGTADGFDARGYDAWDRLDSIFDISLGSRQPVALLDPGSLPDPFLRHFSDAVEIEDADARYLSQKKGGSDQQTEQGTHKH